MARQAQGSNTELARNVTFLLEPVPPFRLDLTVWALRRRPDNVVDQWDGQCYRRALLVDGRPVQVEVVQTTPPNHPRLQIVVHGTALPANTKRVVAAALERLLGTCWDPAEFYRFAAADVNVGPLVAPFRGFKPPRFLTLFETLVNAIACQQVTLTLGIRLLSRLTENCGPIAQGPSGGVHAFPRPEDLAALGPEAMRAMGFSRQKARALVELAENIVDGDLDLEALADLDDDAAVERLLSLRGVGRWTAEYVLLRGLGRLHVFPGDDVGARNNLQSWLGLSQSLDYQGVRHTLAEWERYAGLIYLHLLLKRLRETGQL